ncbi:hypothetical protein [Cryptosporangium phraense]|uniref:FtsH ternary system domain-containing protein n=1 Tax=Cryptosporangium phraense TaxID=2593070 RepID=A0A545AZJ1_9ACTN|nr:hypothetical protein [Cryptosporangium phraense]TQS46760.1 hypothetical protein FL583_00315 [Cryptosporangium phraense]
MTVDATPPPAARSPRAVRLPWGERSAEQSVHAVLRWAVDRTGSLPVGPLTGTRRLGEPSASLQTSLRELAQQHAARLGAGVPPFGDDGSIGSETLLLAAALAGRGQPVLAERLAGTVTPFVGWADAVARHGLLDAVLAGGRGPAARGQQSRVPDPLIDLLRDGSGLTAVLDRPSLRRLGSEATGREAQLAVDLLGRPRGPAVLVNAWSRWSADPEVLRWREELLTRFALSHADAVLDVYTAARARHGGDWTARLGWAATELGSGNADPLALATVRYWAPLASIDRRSPQALRSRRLLRDHRYALTLVHRFRLTRAVQS